MGRLSGGVGELGGSSAGRHVLTWVTGTREHTTSHCAVHVKGTTCTVCKLHPSQGARNQLWEHV